MKTRTVFTIFFIGFALTVWGQKTGCFDHYKKSGLVLFKQGKYDDAMRNYLASLSCDDVVAAEISRLITTNMLAWKKALTDSRDSAYAAREQARMQRDSAIEARKAAESESRRIKAVSYAFLGEQTAEKDPVRGLQLAATGYEITPTPLPRLKLALSNIIAAQMPERDRAGNILRFGQFVPSQEFDLKQGFYKIHFSGDHVFLFDQVHGYSIINKDSLKELVDLEMYGTTPLNLSHHLEKFSLLWNGAPYVSSLKSSDYIQLKIPEAPFSNTILFSKNDNRYAAGLNDGKWAVWDSTGALLVQKVVIDSAENSMYPGVYPNRFIQNGKTIWGHRVFMYGRKPGVEYYHKIKVLNIESGEIVDHSFYNNSPDLNFAHHSDLLLLIDSTDQLNIMNSDWRAVQKISIPREKIRDAAFSPDDEYIFILCESDEYYIYTPTGKQIGHFKRPEYGMITGYAPSSKRIIVTNGFAASRIADRNAIKTQLFDLQGKLIKEMSLTDGVESAGFSPDEKKILGWTQFGALLVWNSNGDLIRKINPLLLGVDRIQDAKFTPDSKEIVCVTSSRVFRYDLNGLHTQEIAFPGKGIECYAEFNHTDDKVILNTDYLIDRQSRDIVKLPGRNEIRSIFADRKHLLSGALYDTVKYVCRLDTNLCWESRALETHMIRFSQSGNEFLSSYNTKGYEDYTAVWDLDKGLLDTIRMGEFGGTKYSAGEGLFVQNDSSILFYNSAGDVFLYSRINKSQRPFHNVHRVTAMDYCPRTQEVATVSTDSILRFYDLSGRLLDSLKLPMTAMVFFDPAGNTDHVVLYGRYDMFFLNRRSGKITTVEKKPTVNANFDGLTFAPKGGTFFTFNYDLGTIAVWDFKGNQLSEFAAHQPSSNRFNAIYSPDGRYILSYASDGTAKLWDIASGAKGNLLAGVYRHTSGVNSAVFSSDGKYLMTAGNDSSVRIYPLPETIFESVKTASWPPVFREELIGLGLEEQ